MLKIFGIINSFVIITLLSIFAKSNTQRVTMFILSFAIEAPFYIFIFITALLFFVIGGFCGMGYNLLKDLKIFRLNRQIKKSLNKESK